MRPTSLFVLGAAGLSSFVSGQTTTLTSTETGSVSSYTSATTVFPSSSTTTSTVTPAATTTASVVPTNAVGSNIARLEGPLAGLVVFAVMAVGLA